MTLVQQLLDVMRTIAPEHLAESWDQVGLHVGNPGAPLSGPVLLTIDLTEAVAAEAISMKAGAIVAYHPPLFNAINRITAADAKGRMLLDLIGAGIAIYSPHTALDATHGGVADWLIDLAGPGSDRAALLPHESLANAHKLVAFVPKDSVDAVRTALSDAGAGIIDDYELCSFMLDGIGTFRGGDATNPTIGTRGTFETVEEVRLEMVCPMPRLPDVVAALRATHPYEEPAFDIYSLDAAPDRSTGPGRALTLDTPASARDIAARVRTGLGVENIRVAAASETPITRIGACPGAGASLVGDVLSEGCQAFITGEMRHHEVLAALERGCSIILAGHTNTERGYLPVLREKMVAIESSLDVRISEADRWPFDVVT
jgi:dinuclear metal center YbgI/SA1388 family protein